MEISELRPKYEELLKANFPKRYLDYSFNSFIARTPEQKEARDAAFDYVDKFHCSNEGTSLVFCGNVGTGKTHLACAIAQEIMCRGHEVHFIHGDEIIEKSGSAFLNIGNTTRFDFLVIDDLYISEQAERNYILRNAMLNFYNEGISFVLTATHSMADLRALLGLSGFDKLFENCGNIIQLHGRSYRTGIRQN